MAGCLFRCKRKSPSPSPKKSPSPRRASNVLNRNMWRKMGEAAPPKERASLARVFGLTKKRSVPILKLEPIISRVHHVINRSRATAKSVKVPRGGFSKLTSLNKINPIAYKNTNWRYYIPYSLHHAYFSNSANGPLFMINTKSGARKNVPARLAIPAATARTTRKATNTWNNYLKRAEAGRRYAAGEGKRTNKYFNINGKVTQYLHGNRNSLKNTSLPDLIYWAQQSTMMSANGKPYVKRGGLWYAYGGGTPVTKKNVLSNIKMYRNMQNNAGINNNAYNPLRNRN